ncbi:uncharacterized protein LOC143281530 [Babylonia areolata]|uniref:uncharacterized protein LOC143281530 n=1 Tax=Babylonia areolata TaxID=304850 RepID=UPI003FCFD856
MSLDQARITEVTPIFDALDWGVQTPHEGPQSSGPLPQAMSSDGISDTGGLSAGSLATHREVDEPEEDRPATAGDNGDNNKGDRNDSSHGADGTETELSMDASKDTKNGEDVQHDTGENEEGTNTTENKKNGEEEDDELSPLNLKSEGKEEDLPSMDPRSNDSRDASGDRLQESEACSVVQETTDSPDHSAISSKPDCSVQSSTDPSSHQSQDTKPDGEVINTNSGENETGEKKGRLVKQAGESPRATSNAAGTPSRPSAAGDNNRQTNARPQMRDRSRHNTPAKVRTQRGGTTGTTSFTNSRQSKDSSTGDSDRKRPSSACKPARPAQSKTPRALTDRNPKRTNRPFFRKNEKLQVHQPASLSKPDPVTESKRIDSKDVKQDANGTDLIQTAGVDDSKASQSTENQTADTKTPTRNKPAANGIIRSGNGGKKTDTKTTMENSSEKDPETQENNKTAREKKSHVLLSRAIMKRVASVENRPGHAFSNNLDRNGSAGGGGGGGGGTRTSVDGKTPCSDHHNMQSLTVPASSLGPAPSEADERVSMGSRKDSVRMSVDSASHKSVDFSRVLTPQPVTMAPGLVEDKPKSVLMHDDSMIRAAIPFLPVRLAVVCLVLNILLPGAGTVVSGFSVLCGSQCRLPSKGDARVMTVCLNVAVGLAQLATVIFLLVGWFWSLAWGVKMVILAVEHRAEKRQQREKELQTLALRAFTTPSNLRRSLLPPV